MKRVIALVGLFTLLLAALLLLNQKRRQSPAYMLTQYQQNQIVKGLTRNHRQQEMIFTDACRRVDISNLIFFGTWFVNKKADLVMHQLVDSDGRTGISRIVSNDSSQVLQTENLTLTPAQLSALRAALQNLPPGQAKPALGDLYMVSFRASNGEWTTRLYDKSNLPPEVVALHKLAVTSKMAGTAIESISP